MHSSYSFSSFGSSDVISLAAIDLYIYLGQDVFFGTQLRKRQLYILRRGINNPHGLLGLTPRCTF